MKKLFLVSLFSRRYRRGKDLFVETSPVDAYQQNKKRLNFASTRGQGVVRSDKDCSELYSVRTSEED